MVAIKAALLTRTSERSKVQKIFSIRSDHSQLQAEILKI
jgi:hypothetical protein